MKSKPREAVDKPKAIKLIIGGVAILIVGAFAARVIWNERRLTADIPMSPLVIDEDEISLEPVSAAEISDHCAEASDNALCRIGLPTIDTPDMKLVSLGTQTKQGNTHIASPSGLYVAGWYNGSVMPGASGITFINAHSSNLHPAPFNRLEELQQGDTITIERGDGTIFTYQVSEVSRITLDAANDWVRSNLGGGNAQRQDGGENLLYLMTCVGSWSLNQGTMSERILVRADLYSKSF